VWTIPQTCSWHGSMVPKDSDWSPDSGVMVAMTMLCGTRIRYCLLVHLVDDDLASGVDEGIKSSSDPIQSMCVACLM
jgi:hypothetical protein